MNVKLVTLVAVAWLVVTAAGAAQSSDTAETRSGAEVMPLNEIVVGMRGTGLTVIRGWEPQTFDVEVLGILPDVFPKQPLIVARLTGLDLERAGVVAGMSGSPVYIDGRVIGAVAYRLTSFGHEAIAGIVPIENMLQMPDPARDPIGAAAPRVHDLLAAMATAMTGGSAELSAAEPVAATAGVEPIGTPMAMSGFHADIVRAVTPLFAGRGWVVGSGAGAAQVRPYLEPGGAVGVQLVRGDVNVTATGTITYRDGPRLLAFGHPFIQAGAVDFPMVAAEVITVLSASQASSKLSVAGSEVLGAIRQDRLPAILGLVGETPRLVPVATRLTAPGLHDTINFEVIAEPSLTPLYVFLGLVNGVQSVGDVGAGGALQVSARLRLADGREVRFDDLYSSRASAIVSLAADLAAVFDGLYDNSLSPIDVEAVAVDLTVRPDRRTATIRRAWHSGEPRRSGEEFVVSVALAPYRQPEEVVPIRVRIPDGLPPGPLRLVVGDASAATAAADRAVAGVPPARDLTEMIARLNSRRRADHVYVQMFRALAGARVGAEVMPGLPGSKLRLLADGAGSGVEPLSQSLLREQGLPVGRVVSGSQEITVTVRER